MSGDKEGDGHWAVFRIGVHRIDVGQQARCEPDRTGDEGEHAAAELGPPGHLLVGAKRPLDKGDGIGPLDQQGKAEREHERRRARLGDVEHQQAHSCGDIQDRQGESSGLHQGTS